VTFSKINPLRIQSIIGFFLTGNEINSNRNFRAEEKLGSEKTTEPVNENINAQQGFLCLQREIAFLPSNSVFRHNRNCVVLCRINNILLQEKLNAKSYCFDLAGECCDRSLKS